MFEAGILSFGVLANNAEIHVFVSCAISGNVLDQDNGCIDVQFLSKSNVERVMARAFDRCVEDALRYQSRSKG